MISGVPVGTVLSLWFRFFLLFSGHLDCLSHCLILGPSSISNSLLTVISDLTVRVKALILFPDQDYWLQPSANSICVFWDYATFTGLYCFWRSCYIHWHKTAFTTNFLLEALCKANWSSILCWSRDSQACWLSVEQERLAPSYFIEFVQKRSTCLPSTFVADLVTELRIAFPGVPQQLNLFLSKANILILFCFWVHEFCGSVLI